MANPRPRPDGKRYRQRVDYADLRFTMTADINPDQLWLDCCAGDPAEVLAARKRMWRRFRTGYYDGGRHCQPDDRVMRESLRRKPPIRRCGAKCRNGQPCRNRPVVRVRSNGNLETRCRMHGGKSTGPKTPQGRAASLAALHRGRNRRARNRPTGE